ncbi:MAG: glycosyltransferase family A protein [Syntrophomonadaceae bacterium]|nr:glycosyltransferase family A protein [Syntrophomonadaceae bacterium]
MISSPRVSVVMAVYNGESYLREAVDSILQQTIPDLEFIIVLDPSDDDTKTILESYIDPRIILLQNDEKLGLAMSLNRGLKLARGKYVARMDADDISLPERLERQVAFMENHEAVGVCGSWLKIIGYDGGWIRELPVDPEFLKCQFIFGCLIAHPTVIMRRDLLVKHDLFYNPDFTHAEDYDLWVRCARHFQIANQSEVLYLYRHHAEQASRYAMEQERYSGLVMSDELKHLGVDFTHEEMEFHKEISVWRIPANPLFADRSRLWLDKLIETNARTNYYPEPVFSEMVNKRWNGICERCGINQSD